MTRKFAVNNIADAINEIIIPKFNAFVTTKKEDPSILKEIADKVTAIELIEDEVYKMTNKVSFSVGDYINYKNLHFYYSTDKEDLILEGTVENIAKSLILSDHHLNYTWHAIDQIRVRIRAIISALPNDNTFEDVLKIVESQIIFEEFLQD